MLSPLVVCLYLATTLHADDVDTRLVSPTSTSTLTPTSPANTPPSSLIDVKEELLKIATTCLTPRDLELLTGNAIRYHVVGNFIYPLIEESVATIGLQELRTTLKLSALPPWKPLNRTEPSERELASATTIDEYYSLREPRKKMRSLDSLFLFEHNIDTAVSYLNKRLPSIRNIFKRTFEEVCPSAPKVLDKEAIDRMIALFRATDIKIHKATSKMLLSHDCWDEFD